MKSENLPPPPTHLLEISEQLEVNIQMLIVLVLTVSPLQDIDYDELNAPPAAVAPTVLPSRVHFERQQQQQQQNQPSHAQPEKRDINPEMLARSLDAPRTQASNATSYPPHIAKFMSRVRNSSTDADDPTQPRDAPNRPTIPSTTMESVAMNDTVLSRQQRSASTKADTRIPPGHQHYDVPRHALSRTISLENANKQLGQPFPIPGVRPRSNTLQAGRGATSYSLPRGHYTPSAMQGAPTRSWETKPSSAHSHTRSDVNPESIWSRDMQMQSVSTHSFQRTSAEYTQNGLYRPQSRPPTVPINVNRQTTGGGDSIPNSPTYFTQHHPHKSEATPSPETQFTNRSFKEHLTSLQPSRGTKRTNMANWMQKSSDYWNSNKSAPFLKDTHAALRTNPGIHPHQRPHLSPSTPAMSTPVFGSKQSHQQPVRATATPPSVAPIPAFQNRQSNNLVSTASATMLQRSSFGGMGASQPLPNYHSTKPATVGDSYYVLDV